jgi:hypothetical protein
MGTGGPVEDPPGPITKAILNKVWATLFDPDAAIYLPRVIKDGYPPWNLPPYDPVTPSGTSAPIPIAGVPEEVADSACARLDTPVIPIATAPPNLQLLNNMLSNLSVISPVGKLVYSATDPVFTATTSVGTKEAPFTLSASDSKLPNYLFQVGCCVPVEDGSRTCSATRWNSDAEGQFVGKTYDATISLTIELQFPQSGPMTIKVVSIAVTADPAKLTIDFDVKGKERWVQELAEIAVNEGIGNNAIVTGLQQFLNQPTVLADIERLVNEAINNFIPHGSGPIPDA